MKRWLIFLLTVFQFSLIHSSSLPRGMVMIDVSRHFMPMSFLYRQVDELARYGVPALHLHLTDAAGWRLEIRKYPQLTEQAAWRTAERWEDWWHDGQRRYADKWTGYGGYYTQDEMRHLVHYAASKGVSIIPEIEFPAHSEEVTAALPWLSCTKEPYTSADYCIGNDSTYIFIADVLREVCDIFPSMFIHMGGDEAGGDHWPSCPRCKDMTQTDAMLRVAGILHQMGRRMICWDEVLTDELRDTSIVIMVWRDPQTARRARECGHDVIYAPARYCYLDKYQDQPSAQPRAMGGYLPIDSIYAHLADSFRGGSEWSLALCLWTEYVPTEYDAERMLWPRVLALAEALKPQPRSMRDFRRWAEKETTALRQRHVNAYDLKREVGQRSEYLRPTKSLSTGCPVYYRIPYHSYYPAHGDLTLTDGLQGGWSNIDGRWQGFLGPVDVVVDLGRMRRPRELIVTFFQSTGVEIFLPSALAISVSSDSIHWTVVTQHDYSADPRPDLLNTYYLPLLPKEGRGNSARFLRLQATPDKRGGWLFTDEILIR